VEAMIYLLKITAAGPNVPPQKSAMALAIALSLFD
jgi:hypothetical protein